MRIISIRSVVIACLVILLVRCNQQPLLNNNATSTNPDTVQFMYIGTYTQKEAHVEGKATGLYIYKLDLTSGKLDYIATSPASLNPSFIAVHPKGTWLYAVNETGSSQGDPAGTISAFRITNEGRGLEFINTVSSAGNYPCYVGIDKTGKYIMTANYGSGTVALLPIHSDGSLGDAVAVDHHSGKGVTSNQESAHAHMIITSNDNRFAYSCDLGTDKIYIYRLDTEHGKLVPAGNDYSTKPGAGPRHMVLHPFKNFAYVINELNGTIECLTVDSLSGELSNIGIVSTLAEGNGSEASCADIHITPSGNYLYASNRGSFNNIAMYSVDQVSGELTLIGHQSAKGKIPRNFIIDPTGTFLLVANQNSDNVVTFRIDESTGKLIDTGMEVSVPTPVCLKFFQKKP